MQRSHSFKQKSKTQNKKENNLENQIISALSSKMEKLFEYPNKLKEIFEKLNSIGAKPIIVGGFVRDALLGLQERKDIDVEVYNIESYKKLTQLLAPYGSVCVVGKSFGVCKLKVDDIECDFSLPRKETKIAKGHKGFEVVPDASLSFKEASKRRDFTINALGYDPLENLLLDEYNGLRDLQNKTLRAVNTDTFIEDPLRVLRGVVFAARFGFHFHPTLTALCKEMIAKDMLAELPKERIFEEFKKLFLKSSKPSRALLLLKHLQEHLYLRELFNLPKEQFKQTLCALDYLASHDEKELALFFAALFVHLKNAQQVLERFTNDKKLTKEVLSLLENYNEILKFLEEGYDDFDLKLAATKINLESVLRFTKALYPQKKPQIEKMYEKAKQLGVLFEPLSPVITGKKLVKMGLAPSKNFKKILDDLYLLQLRGEKMDDTFLKSYLKTNGY